MAPACDQIRNEFSALLDDELDNENRELVEEHLSECADCLRELHGYKQVVDAYRYHHPVKAPDDFEERLQEALAPTPTRAASPWTPMRLAAAAAIVVGVSVAFWRVSQNSQEGMLLSYEMDSAAPTAAEAAPAPKQEGERSALKQQMEPAPLAEEMPALEVLDSARSYEPSRDEADGMDADALSQAVPPAAPMAAESAVENRQRKDAPEFGGGGGGFTAGSTMNDGIANGADSALDGSRVSGPRPSRSLAPKETSELENVAMAEAPQPAPVAPPVDGDGDGIDLAADLPTPTEEREMGAVAARRAPAKAKEALGDATPSATPIRALPLRWNERTFTMVKDVLQQADYGGETFKSVPLPSPQWNTLLDAHPDLVKLVDGSAPVIVKLDDTWYRIEPKGAPSPEAE